MTVCVLEHHQRSLMMAVEGLVLSIPNFSFTQCPIFWSHLFIRLGVHGTTGKEYIRLGMTAVLIIRLVWDGDAYDLLQALSL